MKFKTVDVLSVYTGYLCGEVDGLYQVLNFMCGEDLQTPLDEPFIVNGQTKAEARLIAIPQLVKRFGEFTDLIPMHPEDHENLSPIRDARCLGFKGEIIEVSPDNLESPYGNIS